MTVDKMLYEIPVVLHRRMRIVARRARYLPQEDD
jgi:hypothetical protein